MIKKKITNQSERVVVVNKYHSNYDFYIGRGSVLGNPYPITDIDSRDSVCNKYEEWFEQNKDRPGVKEYLNKILTKAKFGSVSLGCFCKPQRCHGDTIKQWLDQQLGVNVMKNLNDTQTVDMFEEKEELKQKIKEQPSETVKKEIPEYNRNSETFKALMTG